MKGQVKSVKSNVYTVLFNNKEYNLLAKGKLKYNKENIIVGDYVEFNGEVIEKVYERSSFFIRPSVANVEVVVVVLASVPSPDLLLIDKLLASLIKEEVIVIFAVNKVDLGKDLFNRINNEYGKIVNDIIDVSAKNGTNIELLKQKLKGKLTCLAGQSAVGKSSLINSLFNLELRTGELSKKIERGKHTTTYSTIYINDDYKIIDTPGFASLEADISEKDLSFYYPDYLPYINECKYRGCQHINEPSCKIKELVKNGTLNKERYERYVTIYNELKEKRKDYE